MRYFRRLSCICASLALLVALLPSVSVAADSSPFSDVPDNHWGYNSIIQAHISGIVSGYNDGTFRPNEAVNQAEFLAMLARSFPNVLVVRDADSGAPWYKTYYTMAKENSIVFTNKAPADVVFDRGDVADVIYSLIYGTALTEYKSILFLLNTGISSGKTSKTVAGYKARDTLTRAEAVTFLANVKDYVDDKQEGDLLAFRGTFPPPGVGEIKPVSRFLDTTLMEIPLDTTVANLHRILGKPDYLVPTMYPYTWHSYNIGGAHLRYAISDSGKKVVGFYTNMSRDVLNTVEGLSIGKDNVKSVAIRHGMAGHVAQFVLNKDVDISIYYDDHTPNKDVDALLFVKIGYDTVDSSKDLSILDPRAYERGIFDITNSYRYKHGLTTSLTFDEGMTAVARAHSKDMNDKGYFDHTARDGRSPFDRMTDAGFVYSMAGENIAKGYGSDITVMNGWINSEGHRDNILTEGFTHLGVGVVGYTYTQKFFTPVD